MQIPEKFHDQVRKIDVNAHKVQCEFRIWMDQFVGDEIVRRKIQVIETKLKSRFGRSEVLELYRAEADAETRFLAAMIWGHEAPANSKRDSRGPWKVEKMVNSLKDAPGLLDSLKVDSHDNIRTAYESLKKAVDRCGPNFFSKHLYFLGKATGVKSYPLIFDDRVALGVARLAINDPSCTNLVTIHAKAKSHAYLAYLDLAHQQAERIKCQPDQIEYFLFEQGSGKNDV